MTYPTKEMVQIQEQDFIKKLSLETLAQDKKDEDKSQNMFIDNLKHRIDARIVKNLKDKKEMM